MANIIRIPITNFFLGGDYSGRILVGPEKRPLNVILDTGSSALALDGKKYSPELTKGDVSTKQAQTDSYGDGSSWTGAVIHTTISAGDGNGTVSLPGANAAVAYTASANMFTGVDGILGLAYAPLDDAFTMPEDTWAHKYTATQVRAGNQGDLVPFLTQLADANIASEKIAFLTRRSFTHVGNGGANDPLNQGWMVLGGGEESTDLYSGTFQTVKVVSDDWYSTNLKEVVVGTSAPVVARRQGPKGMPSNSIIDSGTNSLNISAQMLKAIISKFSPSQQALLNQSVIGQELVRVADLNLATWPTLTFVLQSDTGVVRLEVAPGDYWQVNTQDVGMAAAAITVGQPGLAILGLPLMNGYFTIFDGTAEGGRGVVKFAKRKP